MNDADDTAALRRTLQETLNAVAEIRKTHENVNPNFADAACKFYAARNRMLDAKRAGRLQDIPADLPDRMNAIASLMSSVEYPMSGIHWKRMDQIDEALRKMLDEWKAGTPA